MIFILVIILTLLFWITMMINANDMMNPAVWAVGGFWIASIGGALNYNKWGDISYVTIIVIIISLLFFLIGSIIGKNLIKKKNDENDELIDTSNREGIRLNRFIVFIMNIVMIITAVLYFKFMFQNALIGGATGKFEHIFSYARLAEQNGTALKISNGLTFLIKLCFGFAYVQTYIVIHNWIYMGKKYVRKLDLFTICLYMVHAIVSGGRTKMLYYVVFITIVAITLNRNKNNWNQKSKKIGFRYIALSVFAGLLFFWLIDNTVRGSVYGSTFRLWDQFSKYISSPIYALSEYLKNPTYMRSFSETETLYPVLSILKKLGGNIYFNNNALNFVQFGVKETVITNIYTVSRRYIHDFGYWGLTFLMFFEGMIYGRYYKKICINKISGIRLILYGALVYPVAFYFIEERFINDLFTLNNIFQIFCIVLFWKLIKRDFKKNRVEVLSKEE